MSEQTETLSIETIMSPKIILITCHLYCSISVEFFSFLLLIQIHNKIRTAVVLFMGNINYIILNTLFLTGNVTSNIQERRMKIFTVFLRKSRHNKVNCT